MIGQLGFVEYTSFKYFPIITKETQLIYEYLKYDHYECLLVVNSSKYQKLYVYIYATYGLVVDQLV